MGGHLNNHWAMAVVMGRRFTHHFHNLLRGGTMTMSNHFNNLLCTRNNGCYSGKHKDHRGGSPATMCTMTFLRLPRGTATSHRTVARPVKNEKQHV